MAIGFPASFETTQELVGDRTAAREAVAYALSVLGWHHEQSDPDHFLARVPVNPLTFGETLRISIESNLIVVKSQCDFPLPMIDWGENKQNVKAFLVNFSAKEIRDLMLGSHEPIGPDHLGRTPLERALNETNLDNRHDERVSKIPQ